jgi:hypothetical protein
MEHWKKGKLQLLDYHQDLLQLQEYDQFPWMQSLSKTAE